MIANRPYILYSLPKSRTTQALIGRRIDKSFQSVRRFLDSCTNANPDLPSRISIVAYTAFGENESIDYANKIIEDTSKIFGQGTRTPIGFMYPSGQPHEQNKVDWTLTPDDLKKAMDYLINGEPYQKFNLGPIELIISYDFKLVDLDSKKELPDQQYTSSILIWLSRTNSCNLTLCLPFDKPDLRFYEYLDRIEPLLPCKLEKKYLRLGQANKQKTMNKFTKI
jgi:hypothetical protein